MILAFNGFPCWYYAHIICASCYALVSAWTVIFASCLCLYKSIFENLSIFLLLALLIMYVSVTSAYVLSVHTFFHMFYPIFSNTVLSTINNYVFLGLRWGKISTQLLNVF